MTDAWGWSARALLKCRTAPSKSRCSAATLPRLRPGLYAFVVDRYGFLRVGPIDRSGIPTRTDATSAMLAQGDPVLVAGQLVITTDGGASVRIREININSEEYFFSNLSMSLYQDVEDRSDRYVISLGHALKALDLGRVPRDDIVLKKF